MPHKYAELMFTDDVKQIQREMGSRSGYESMEHGEDYNFLFSDVEASFIEGRDSFYMASVNNAGWPYVQHRGGPQGFMRVLDNNRLGFADFSGNRQYVSAGNFRGNNRVSIFFMDYPNQRRLKLSGRIEQVADDDWDTLVRLEVEGYPAAVERGFVIHVEAFDWNCPKYITPRFTELEMSNVITPLLAENKRLKSMENNKDKPDSVGEGELPLVVTGIRQLTPHIRAFELRHRDDIPLPVVSAGAHLSIPIVLESGERIIRRYSVCSNPSRRDIYEIAVRQELEGAGGSKAIHEKFGLGFKINCGLPENFFELHTDNRPTVLIAAGIGITPIKSMAQQLAKQGREFSLHYAGKQRSEMAFQDRLSREFDNKIHFYYSKAKQRLSCEKILTQAPENSVFYVCGPQRLVDEMLAVAATLGVDIGRIHYERFSVQSATSTHAFTAELVKSNVTLEVSDNQSLLEAILEEGIAIPSSCNAGECRSCVVKIDQGEVEHRDNCLTVLERESWMCPCVSRAKRGSIAINL